MNVNDLLTSIQDAISCLEERARNGWPSEDERLAVNEELADIDARLWELCEVDR